jgi:hypothetical protein
MTINDTAQAALFNAGSILTKWLSGGVAIGGEYIACNPTRADRKRGSFKINLATGKWADFATSDRGGDLVSLVAYLDGVSQGEAARRIQAELGQEPRQLPTADTVRHPTRGRPLQVWTYADAAGNLIGKVCRFEDGGKVVLPFFKVDGRWRWKAPTAPRLLYNLPALIDRPTTAVIVTEGEKAADAAARLLPEAVVTTWQGGCKAYQKTDWTPLAGRTVILWPDADRAGIEAMQGVRDILWKLSCRIVLPALPSNLPKGFDAADVTDREQALAILAGKFSTTPTEESPANGKGYYLPTEQPADADGLFKLLPARLVTSDLPPRQGVLVPASASDREPLKWSVKRGAFVFV